MGPNKFLQHLRKTRGDKVLRSAESQLPAQLRAREISLRAVDGVEDAMGERDHGLAVDRHGNRMRVANKQAPAGLLLEVATLRSDGCLRSAEPLGGLREAPGLGD